MAVNSSKKNAKKQNEKDSKETEGTATPKQTKKARKKKTNSSKNRAKKSKTSKKKAKTKRPKLFRASIPNLTALVLKYDNEITKGAKYRKSMDEIAFNSCTTGGTLKELGSLLGVSKETIVNWRKERSSLDAAIIEGYKDWLSVMPKNLIAHLSEGKSYTTFAAKLNRSRAFLAALENTWEDFKTAKEIGLVKSQAVWEDIGMRQAVGQITIDLGEVPLMGNGQVIKDDDGNMIMVKRKAQAKFSDRALTFMMQNRFDDYKPTKDTTNSELLDDLKYAIDAIENEGKEDGLEVEQSTETIE